MSHHLPQSSAIVSQLSSKIESLNQITAELKLPQLAGREWYELFRRKIKPQLGDHSFLIVAVVGGTNIGKSAIFNHIAGKKISSSSAMASGTKHPTALLNPELLEQISLQDVFPGFLIEPWTEPDAPLQESPNHYLYFKTSPQAPKNLIILDSPDIDSVAEINWERAANLRQTADVLIAVLTQQKYNDAAIKRFFRIAADEGKFTILIFNQVLLPEDEEYWPLWLESFRSSTSLAPTTLYVAPNDRRAAEEIRLPFYERPVGAPSDSQIDLNTPHDLMQDLSALKFEEIRDHSLQGAIRHFTSQNVGIPTWLKEIRFRAHEFEEAYQLLSGDKASIENWPLLPNSILISQLRKWWGLQRAGLTAKVHGAYNWLGQAITAPINYIRHPKGDPLDSAFEKYRKSEWEAILEAIRKSYIQLEQIRNLGNPILKDSIEATLLGTDRLQVLTDIKAEHEKIDFRYEVKSFIDSELQNFRTESPESYKLFKKIDSFAAATRPAISVGLFFTGAGPFGDALTPVIADTAFRGVLHLAGEAVGGTVVTTVGDQVLSSTASTSMGYIESRLRRLHTEFSRRRGEWVMRQIYEKILKDLPGKLLSAASIPQSETFKEVEDLIHQFHEKFTITKHITTGSESVASDIRPPSA